MTLIAALKSYSPRVRVNALPLHLLNALKKETGWIKFGSFDRVGHAIEYLEAIDEVRALPPCLRNQV